MFGGKNEEGLSKKFFKLSIKLHDDSTISIDTRELDLPEQPPSPRIFHTLTLYDSHHINLIGGCSIDYKTIYDDSWIYNTNKNEWKKEDDEIYGKSGHTVECISKKVLYIFGGMYSNYETVNTLEVKSYSKTINDEDETSKLNSLLLRPGSRRGHSSCHISKVMFIFGGFNGSSFYNDMYMFGKKSDIKDLEEEALNCEMINYCDKNIDKVNIPNSWKRNNNDDESNIYYYDSRLISYYPFAYEVAKSSGFDDLNTITEKLGKMIDNSEDPDNEINPRSFCNYLTSSNSKQPSKFEELQRRVREKVPEPVQHKTIFPCRICNNQVITHVLTPCGCFCICEKCAESIAGKV